MAARASDTLLLEHSATVGKACLEQRIFTTAHYNAALRLARHQIMPSGQLCYVS